MSNVLAAIGRGQMQVLESRVKTRSKIDAHYLQELSDTPGISFLPGLEGFYSNRWLTTILVDPEATGGVTHEDLRLALEKENIESRPLWKPMHLQPVFASAPFYGNGNSRVLFEKGLCLPSGTQMGENEIERVVRVIKEVIGG
jgi:dTDP-4-amino-4,6-dideoxygalactose transaminase